MFEYTLSYHNRHSCRLLTLNKTPTMEVIGTLPKTELVLVGSGKVQGLGFQSSEFGDTVKGIPTVRPLAAPKRIIFYGFLWFVAPSSVILLMILILHHLRDHKLWELWYIPHYG